MRLSLLLFLAVSSGYSQELNLPILTQYLADNPFVISPTYAGIGDNLRIRANGLAQWIGLKDAPNNQSLFADFRIMDRSGVGISLYNDKNGYTRQTGAKISFAHHLTLDYYSKQYLSFGLSYNFNHFRIDSDKFNLTIEQPVMDAMVKDRNVANNNFDIGVLYRLNKFYLSLSGNNILKKVIKKDIRAEPVLLFNYQLYSGYIFKDRYNRRIEYEPSIYFQYFAGDKRSTTDLNIKYRQYNGYDDYYWIGISYRMLNDQSSRPLSVGPMAGFKKSKFYLGYSYQLTLSQMGSYNAGTHSITIGLDFLESISNCPCTHSPVHD
ncbi:PorP/SprF family type IX secretion system membrane protein [Flavobacterium sp. 3-210]